MAALDLREESDEYKANNPQRRLGKPPASAAAADPARSLGGVAVEQRTKKNGEIEWTKPPRQVRNPNHNAKSNDPTILGPYSAAVQRVAAGAADGIGFML